LTPATAAAVTHCLFFSLAPFCPAGNLKDLLTAAQLSGNVPRTVNSGDKLHPLFDPAADPKKSKDSHKIREKVSMGLRGGHTVALQCMNPPAVCCALVEAAFANKAEGQGGCNNRG